MDEPVESEEISILDILDKDGFNSSGQVTVTPERNLCARDRLIFTNSKLKLIPNTTKFHLPSKFSREPTRQSTKPQFAKTKRYGSLTAKLKLKQLQKSGSSSSLKEMESYNEEDKLPPQKRRRRLFSNQGRESKGTGSGTQKKTNTTDSAANKVKKGKLSGKKVKGKGLRTYRTSKLNRPGPHQRFVCIRIKSTARLPTACFVLVEGFAREDFIEAISERVCPWCEEMCSKESKERVQKIGRVVCIALAYFFCPSMPVRHVIPLLLEVPTDSEVDPSKLRWPRTPDTSPTEPTIYRLADQQITSHDFAELNVEGHWMSEAVSIDKGKQNWWLVYFTAHNDILPLPEETNQHIGTTNSVHVIKLPLKWSHQRWGREWLLFHPRFVVPIPSSLYHPARIRVDISLISP